MSALPQLPKSQSAIVQGSGGQLQVAYDAAVPDLQPRTVLVKTVAVALNPYDYKMPLHFPMPGAIGGSDFVGTIVRIDDEASKLRPDLAVGDIVYGCVYSWNPRTPEVGTFAQFLKAPAQLLYKLNSYDKVQVEEAATLGAALATMCLALWYPDALALPGSPEKPLDLIPSSPAYVLVSGYTPIATCSPKNFALAESYGAQHVFDYADPNTPSAIRKLTSNKLEYALDCITDDYSVACCHSAIGRAGGRLATLELPPEPKPSGPRRRNAVKHTFVDGHEVFGEGVWIDKPGYSRDPSPEKHLFAVHKARVFQRLIDEGKLRAHPVQVLDGGFDGIVKGLGVLKAGSVSGKKLVVYVQ